ncbi:MAG: GldG family protein [Patescibacteria group bacterium]|nr:GldG family protein [Patescibacteria group bacterium]
MRQKIRKLIQKFLYLFLILGIVVLNYFLSFVNWKIDFSTGQAYSLSESTKKILRKINKEIQIKFFVSSNLPTRLVPFKNEVRDFLREYENSSKKVKVKILDPQNDSQVQEEVQKLGIPELQYSQLETDSYQVKKVYFGLSVEQGDKKEIIPRVADLATLEYEISSSIYKIIKDKKEKIGIIGAKEEISFSDSSEDQLSSFKKLLEDQYQLELLVLEDDQKVKELSQDYKLVLIFDTNQKKYSSEELEKIDKYLNQDFGRAIFFVDGLWINDQALIAQRAESGLSQYLEKKWGTKINEDLVLSLASELVNFGSANFQFITNYQYWIRTNNFNRSHNLFTNVNTLVFPWVSSVNLTKSKDFDSEILVKSVTQSWARRYTTESAYFIDPNSINAPERDKFQTKDLITAIKKDNRLKIVVIPSSRLVFDRFLGQNDNLNFALNLVNEMAAEGILSGIRQRIVSFYQLPTIENGNLRNLIKYTLILLLPVSYAFFGFFRILYRAKK